MVEQRIINLLYLLTSVISVNVAEDSKYFSPSGVAMCEQLCLRTVGCGRFQYSFRHLSCGLLVGKTTEQGPHATFKVFAPKKNKEKLDGLSGKRCQSMAMIFPCKRTGFICRVRSPNPKAASWSKILIIKERRGNIKQMDTRDRTVSRYFPTFKGAYGMAYVPKSERLVYCDLRRKLHMMALDGSNRQFITENCLGVIGVAEDQIFIFTVDFSRKRVRKRVHYSMSPFGTNLTKIIYLFWEPESIAVDMKRRRLYISSDNRIRTYDYKGNFQRTIKGYRVAIEPFSDWMYIVPLRGKKYNRMLLTTFQHEFFRSKPRFLLKVPPCIVDNILYAPTIGCDIMIISKTGDALVKTFEKGFLPCHCSLLHLP